MKVGSIGTAMRIFSKANSGAEVFVGTQGTLCVKIKNKHLSKGDINQLKELGWEGGQGEWFIAIGG